MEQEKNFILPGLGQVAVVVKDIDQAVNYYSTNFGIGPFGMVDIDLPNTTVRGKPVSLKLRLGIANVGPVRFELIEVPDGESVFQEFVDRKGEGLHHLGFDVADLDKEVAKLERQGIGVLMTCKWDDGRAFAYLDTERDCGFVIELSQRP